MIRQILVNLSHFNRDTRRVFLHACGYSSLIDYETTATPSIAPLFWNDETKLFERCQCEDEFVYDDEHLGLEVPLSSLSTEMKEYLYDEFLADEEWVSFEAFYTLNHKKLPSIFFYVPKKSYVTRELECTEEEEESVEIPSKFLQGWCLFPSKSDSLQILCPPADLGEERDYVQLILSKLDREGLNYLESKDNIWVHSRNQASFEELGANYVKFVFECDEVVDDVDHTLNRFIFIYDQDNDCYVLTPPDVDEDKEHHPERYSKNGWRLFKKHRRIYFNKDFNGFLVSVERKEDLELLGARYVKVLAHCDDIELVEKEDLLLHNWIYVLNNKTKNSYILTVGDVAADKKVHPERYGKKGWKLFEEHRPIYFRSDLNGFIVSLSHKQALQDLGATLVSKVFNCN